MLCVYCVFAMNTDIILCRRLYAGSLASLSGEREALQLRMQSKRLEMAEFVISNARYSDDLKTDYDALSIELVQIDEEFNSLDVRKEIERKSIKDMEKSILNKVKST